MSTEPNEQLDVIAVAFHEAGHAALNIHFDRDLVTVSIAEDETSAGRVDVDSAGDDDLKYEIDDSLGQVEFERVIMTALAGEIAQSRYSPASVCPGGADGDWRIVGRYLDELDAPTEEIRDAYVRLLRLRAASLVDNLWPRIERLAAALVERKTLSADDARQAFADPRMQAIADRVASGSVSWASQD